MPPRPRAVRSSPSADYVDVFEVALPEWGPRSPQEWARAVFEGAGPVLGALLRLGWRHVLGLRLVPRSAPDQVLGWAVVERRAGAIVLGLDGPGLASRLTVAVDGSILTQTTRVRLDSRCARARWAVVRPVHRRVVPHLLGRAARGSGNRNDSRR